MSEFERQFPKPKKPQEDFVTNIAEWYAEKKGWVNALKWALDNAVCIHSPEISEKIIEQEIAANE